MLWPTGRQQQPDQRDHDVQSEVGQRLVRARVDVERDRNEEGCRRQSENRPAQLHPPTPAGIRDRERRRYGLHHLGLAVSVIGRA